MRDCELGSAATGFPQPGFARRAEGEVRVDLGHKVVGPVARLDEAQEMAQREAFDIAILDVNINGGEAYPIAEALAARDIPFVF